VPTIGGSSERTLQIWCMQSFGVFFNISKSDSKQNKHVREEKTFVGKSSHHKESDVVDVLTETQAIVHRQSSSIDVYPPTKFPKRVLKKTIIRKIVSLVCQYEVPNKARKQFPTCSKACFVRFVYSYRMEWNSVPLAHRR
jgi:hypothetical protein